MTRLPVTAHDASVTGQRDDTPARISCSPTGAGQPVGRLTRLTPCGHHDTQVTLKVALDATPLEGARTGVGEFCQEILEAFATRPDLEVGAFAISRRGRRGIAGLLPPGVKALGPPGPASPPGCSTHRGRDGRSHPSSSTPAGSTWSTGRTS